PVPAGARKGRTGRALSRRRRGRRVDARDRRSHWPAPGSANPVHRCGRRRGLFWLDGHVRRVGFDGHQREDAGNIGLAACRPRVGRRSRQRAVLSRRIPAWPAVMAGTTITAAPTTASGMLRDAIIHVLRPCLVHAVSVEPKAAHGQPATTFFLPRYRSARRIRAPGKCADTGAAGARLPAGDQEQAGRGAGRRGPEGRNAEVRWPARVAGAGAGRTVVVAGRGHTRQHGAWTGALEAAGGTK